MQPESDVPEHLCSTITMVRKAYPTLPSRGEYMALLSLLCDYMSDSNLADAITLAYGIDWGLAYNDGLRSVTTDKPNAIDLAQARQRLNEAGYEAWMREELG